MSVVFGTALQAAAIAASASDASGQKFTSIGGQAVLEGVMMRSPNFVSVAVRAPSGKIIIKSEPYATVFKRLPFLKRPLLRGVVTLVESMVQGLGALSFSAEIGDASTEEKKPLSKREVAISMIFAFAMAMLLFVALPHGLTVLLTSERFFAISVDSPIFHLIDGVFKMAILLAYVGLIARIPEIRRVFQYHGAEHKAIYTFESGKDLTVENARAFTTLHPRCGTSFLLFLVVISIAMFSILLPILGLTRLSENPWLNHTGMVGVKILFMFPVAGLAYEVIKLSAKHLESPFFRWVMAPGLWLQNLTTREPEDDQLEIALVSLRQVLALEKAPREGVERKEIQSLSEVAFAPSRVEEFLEA